MRLIVAIIFSALCAGCVGAGKVRHVAESPVVSVLSSGEVNMAGDAEKPAKVETDVSNSVMTIPEASTFVFNEKLGTMTLTVSKATQLAVNRKETVVEGPKSFTPDRAPTIGEELKATSDATANLWYKIGLAAGFALAAFGLVKNWNLIMYGGAAISAGCGIALFISNHPFISFLIGAGAAAVIIGPTIYHTVIKKLENKNETKNV